MLSPKTLIAITLAAVLAALCYFSYSTYGKLQVSQLEAKQAKADLEVLQAAKARSDEAVARLTIDLAKNSEVTTRTITKLVKVPVSVQEKCVSDVLKESLRDD